MKKSFLACLLVLALLATLLSGCAVTEKKQTTPTGPVTGPSVTTPISTDPDLPGLTPELAELAGRIASFAGIEGLLGRVTGIEGDLPRLDVDAFQGGITANVSVDGVGEAGIYASEGYFGFAAPFLFEGTAVITPEEIAAIMEIYDLDSLLSGSLGADLPIGETDPEAMMEQFNNLIRVVGEQAVYSLAFLPEGCVQIIHNEEASVELRVSVTAADAAVMFNGYGEYLLKEGRIDALASALAPFLAGEYTEAELKSELEAFAGDAKTVTADDIDLPDVDMSAGYYNDGSGAWLSMDAGEFYLQLRAGNEDYSPGESDYASIKYISLVLGSEGTEYEVYAGVYTPFYSNANTTGAEILLSLDVDGQRMFELDAGMSITTGTRTVLRPYIVLMVDGGIIEGANLCIEGEIIVERHPGDLTYVIGSFESAELNDFYDNDNYTGMYVLPIGVEFELVYDPAGTVETTFPDPSTWIPLSEMFGY